MFQNKLPRLPIPPLSSTKSQLIEWIRPLVDDQQLQKTSSTIDYFFKEGGVAEKLQDKLYEWDQTQAGSWLQPFWDDMYLNHRESLPSSMNFNVLLKENPRNKDHTMTRTAGKVSYLVTEFYHHIIDGTLKADHMTNPSIDLSQYKYFFRSIRIPQNKRDAFYVADFDKRNNHVVLIYKNNMYKVPVTNDKGIKYSSQHITGAIEAALAKGAHESINVGLFTTADRDQAAEVYNELIKSKVNAHTLQMIADALVVISVDEESNNSEEAINNLMLAAKNKYFDKTIQIIITTYGAIGFNLEHSAIDGPSIASVIRYVNQGLEREFTHTGQTDDNLHVDKLTWELSTEIKAKLTQFEQDHMKRKDMYFLNPYNFIDFGADQIKKLGLSPDAFFHMALQLAQYRTYGKLRSVYEPVSVHFFHKGRTESARATSMEKRHLVEAIEANIHSNEQLYSLMQTASDAHTNRIRDCQKGQGVERHLFGLEQMYHLFGSELGLNKYPAIFQDEGYRKLRHDFISTSGMAYDNAEYRMFAPVVDHGHGVAYFILDHSISINISSFAKNKTKGKQLMEHMVEALHELKKITEVGRLSI